MENGSPTLFPLTERSSIDHTSIRRSCTSRRALYITAATATGFAARLRGWKTSRSSVSASTTDQRFVTDGETWQDAIRDLSGIEVANAGVDGLSSSGHVFAVREWLHRIPGLRPRGYLHYLGINDALYVLGLSKNDPALRERMASLRERQMERPDLDILLRYRSALYRNYLRLTAWLAGPPPIASVPVFETNFSPAMADRRLVQDYINTVYQPNLLKLFALHRQRGEKVILASQPLHPSVFRREGDAVLTSSAHLGPFARALAIMNDTTERMCREHAPDCAFIDVAKGLSHEPGDYYDSMHVTPAGARRLGAFLAQEIARLGWPAPGRNTAPPSEASVAAPH